MEEVVPQLKRCTRCGEEYVLSHFRFNHGNHENTCRTCRSALKRKWTIANKVHSRGVRQRYVENPIGRARVTLLNMKSRCRKENWCDPEFTIEEIVEAIDGKHCAKTGIPFSLATTSSRTNPLAPSPDRIDSSLGYTKANVQWVCWMYNLMKNDFTPEDVNSFLDGVVRVRQSQQTTKEIS